MANLLLAIWLILVGITWADWVAISAVILGILAIITGILLLVGGRGYIEPIVRR